MTNKGKTQSMMHNDKQTKKGRQWPFTKKQGGTWLKQPLTPSPAGLPPLSAKLFHHITKMPLCKFIDCDIDENYEALIIEGTPTEQELLSAWLLIKTQYADIIGNQEYILYRNGCRDLNVLKITLIEVEMLVSVMRKLHSPLIAERLNKLVKARFQFNTETPDQYNNDLDACITRTGSIKIQIDIKAAQMKAMEGKHEQGQRPTREYYHKILISLSDHAGYELKDTISVFDFCERVKRFNKFCEQQKTQKNVRRVNR